LPHRNDVKEFPGSGAVDPLTEAVYHTPGSNFNTTSSCGAFAICVLTEPPTVFILIVCLRPSKTLRNKFRTPQVLNSSMESDWTALSRTTVWTALLAWHCACLRIYKLGDTVIGTFAPGICRN